MMPSGNKQKPSSMDDLYALDLNTFTWYKLDQSLGSLPLAGHSLSRSNISIRGVEVDCLIIFGGYCSQNKIYSNMLFICEVDDIRCAVRTKKQLPQLVRWRTLKFNGKPPPPRFRYVEIKLYSISVI